MLEKCGPIGSALILTSLAMTNMGVACSTGSGSQAGGNGSGVTIFLDNEATAKVDAYINGQSIKTLEVNEHSTTPIFFVCADVITIEGKLKAAGGDVSGPLQTLNEGIQYDCGDEIHLGFFIGSSTGRFDAEFFASRP